MQEFVFFIGGEVNHPLTIDPTVWIFDERKVDLLTYFKEEKLEEDDETLYTKAISAQWDKELTEGSEPPNPNKNGNEIKYDKQKLINGTYGMPLRPFLINANPSDTVNQVTVERHDGTKESYDYDKALTFILGFSNQGKPLREDGPVHIYFGDGSNQDSPVRQVKRLILK
ncbi:hypothetical protein [Bacillus solitudinis]|uniref:hypothetical protein n=1 Tax=Bacillus solitudinis TaxID=2014074 RepID=UPI000C240B8A|nr:hypothetical protein [Bacillus solitudinis]